MFNGLWLIFTLEFLNYPSSAQFFFKKEAHLCGLQVSRNNIANWIQLQDTIQIWAMAESWQER